MRGNGKISARFRSINIMLFSILLVMISITMLFVLNGITNTVSKEYAELYSSDTARTLDTYFGSQIALIRKAARSNAVIDWLDDEYDLEKKLAAHEEMMEIIDSLPSKNLYLGIEKTLHEFTVEENFTVDDIEPFATLKPNYFDDAWYFECTGSHMDYLLNVDIDKILDRKRVWLNYKVTHDDKTYGAICTWLEFSDIVQELFAEYDCNTVRGLVVDENGTIQMDSTSLGGEDFLHYTAANEETGIADEFSDPAFLSAFKKYTENMDGYFDIKSGTVVIELSGGKYRYATIAPIASTTWSVVTFYNASSLFSVAKTLPLIIIVLTMLIIFIIATSFASKKLIFDPFYKLTHSISHMKSNQNGIVYGTERRDEIGEIANTVQNMKDNLIDALGKLHYDSLTGIYNRRYLDDNLNRIVKSLSRSGGSLGVMMLDVDFFKKYNDTYGHSMGDDCLKKIALELSGNVKRANDFVARYGGEEFIIILPDTDERGSRVIANRLLESISMCRIPHEKSDVSDYVTVSIGVTACVVSRSKNAGDYIKRSDEALYISKHNGRNRYTFLDL